VKTEAVPDSKIHWREGKDEPDEYIPPSIPVGDEAALSDPNLLGMVMPRGTVMRGRANGGRARGGGKATSNSLPAIPVEPSVSTVFRYQRAGTANSYVITVGDIAKAVVAAASATTYRYMIRTFKIQCVTLRGSAGAVGSSAAVSLRYLGTNTSEQRILDNSSKIDVNAMVRRTPPRYSLASFWHDVESDTLSTPLIEVTYFGTGELFLDLALTYLIDVDRYIDFTLAGGTGLNNGGLYKGNLSGSLTNGLIPTGGQRLGA
jgi:hypothetical protein